MHQANSALAGEALGAIFFAAGCRWSVVVHLMLARRGKSGWVRTINCFCHNVFG